MKASGVILAAGAARRFGRPKPLLDFGGEPLIRRVVRQAVASRLADTQVVVGYRGEEIGFALAGHAVSIVDNPRWSEGQSTSVRAGVSHLPSSTEAALFINADQPFVTTELIDRLVATWKRTGAGIVVPACEGRRGSPVLFAHRLFSELEAIEGDRGGRQLFERHEHELHEMPWSEPLALADIDTEDDYRRLLARLDD